MRIGLVVSFSGIDGAGKTTQANLLIEQIRKAGRTATRLWGRAGHTAGCEAVKRFARLITRQASGSDSHRGARAQAFAKPWICRFWVTIAILDLLRLYSVKVRTARLTGRVQVCDRYLWDSLIDFQLRFPLIRVEGWWLWRLLARTACVPDAAFLLLVPAEEGVLRSSLTDPYQETDDLAQQRFLHYRMLAGTEEFHVLDGLRPADLLHREVLDFLRKVEESGGGVCRSVSTRT